MFPRRPAKVREGDNIILRHSSANGNPSCAATVKGALLDGALELAELGWRVIPLHDLSSGACSCGKVGCSPGKHPRWHKDDLSNGLSDGTTDPELIGRWWSRWPTANLGVCTGPDSGLFMLGPDGEAGIEALAELVRKYAGLPRTPTARSGSGGRHYYFRWSADGGGIINRRNHRGLPIDVRGEGGYFVAPPSRNKSGIYVWEIHPSDCELAEAPKWLLAWCRSGGEESKSAGSSLKGTASKPPSITDRAIKYLEKMPPAISGQGGHDRTLEAARAWPSSHHAARPRAPGRASPTRSGAPLKATSRTSRSSATPSARRTSGSKRSSMSSRTTPCWRPTTPTCAARGWSGGRSASGCVTAW